MRNILVLLDLSNGAEHIARTALNLARLSNANLLLCNSVNAKVTTSVFATNEDEDWTFADEHQYTSLKELAWHLNNSQLSNNVKTTVSCLESESFIVGDIKNAIKQNDVWMILTGVETLKEIKQPSAANQLRQMIDHATCPVLVIPQNTHFTIPDKIAYLTDLRYCSLQATSFLKLFNAYIFVTHVSAAGIPDIEDNYAQSLLSDEIASKLSYNKLFLRNIKGKDIGQNLSLIVKTTGVKLFAVVNKQHQLLDRFLNADGFELKPLLIMPYLNWQS
jgi:nucleotide-binding universal stress UspA family protein